MSDPHDYTVGWICAINTEFVAAQAFLDERHSPPISVAQHNNASYELGKISNHNVVIAVLPDGEYGLVSASSVARDMLHTFPNVRIGLMVGIGGGGPSPQHDIRLGDVIVSSPRNGTGGVVQYDFGKVIQGQPFLETGFLNQPPSVLRSAVARLRATYELNGHQLQDDINKAIQKKPRLQKKYSRPPANRDMLYKSDYLHQSPNGDCLQVCGNNPSNILSRDQRGEDEDEPMIHYGLVASANCLMKDATIRDKLAAEKGFLCFEMEAAGLMNNFPCLVIRGICDYADTHKNKDWQGFAAMAAAAYAKDLLRLIHPDEAGKQTKIADIISGLHEIAEEHRDIAEEQLEIQKDQARARLSKEEQYCHQLFRITTSEDTTYEWYKDRVEERVDGTCLWFLKHDNFQKWLKRDSGPLLVTADPGCGKSVLVKYLIDHALPQSTTICYFFFKDQDQNKTRQALCALLHQLFTQKPCLIKYAMAQFGRDGRGLINSTESLWTVLQNATKDPLAGHVIMVLDALDECKKETELVQLVKNIRTQFCSDQSGHGNLKFLLTCRPYEAILSEFRSLLNNFPHIHIPGEEELGTISEEVNRVITHRVTQLAERKKLSPEIKSYLERRLQETTHRTYLWVSLVFDYLEKKHLKNTLEGIKSAIATLPKNVHEAYEQILNESEEHPMVRKALSIILAARRPLTLSEMNVAVNVDSTVHSLHLLDLENEDNFKLRLRSWCGLFVSIYDGKIYFLHQTAREFLLAEFMSPTTIRTTERWRHSIHIDHAHAIIAELCVLYLNFFNSTEGIGQSVDRHAFLDYSARTWGIHFREANIVDDAPIVLSTLDICDPHSRSFSIWFKIYWESTNMAPVRNFTDLIVASYFGHGAIVNSLLTKTTNIETKDIGYGRTPLLWAVRRGHHTIVELLLGMGADIEAKDSWAGQAPLSLAAQMGHPVIVELLLKKGADSNSQGRHCQTPLLLASQNGHEDIVKLLLKFNASTEIEDTRHFRTPLLWAVERGHDCIVKLLLERGADVKMRDGSICQRPLSLAMANDHEAIVKLLLERDIDANLDYDQFGQPLIWWAIENGHVAVVALLFNKGKVGIETKDRRGQTALSWAGRSGKEAMMKYLLEQNADIESKDMNDRTPLSWAAGEGHQSIVKYFLRNDARTESVDKNGWTPLWWATKNGHMTTVEYLLRNGARVDSVDDSGRTLLSWAAGEGHQSIVRYLTNFSEKAAGVDSVDKNGWTPLWWATKNRHTTTVEYLLRNGARVDPVDDSGRTPLSWAAGEGHQSIVKYLLRNDARIESVDRNGRTPLSWAAEHGHECIVQLLCHERADIEASDQRDWTPLWYAVREQREAVVRFLFDAGAEVKWADKEGKALLRCSLWSQCETAVEELIGKGANIDQVDHGRTLLSLASEEGREDTAPRERRQCRVHGSVRPDSAIVGIRKRISQHREAAPQHERQDRVSGSGRPDSTVLGCLERMEGGCATAC